MNDQYRGFLRLLRAGLTGKGEELPGSFSLEQAYPFAKKHQISTLIYEGARLCGADRQLPVMRELFRDACQELMFSERQMRAVAELRAAMDEAGVDYLFFKGVVMKQRYPRPEMRVMGDADFLIHDEQMPAVDEVLRRLGYEPKSRTDYECEYASPALTTEPHRMLVDPEYPEDLAVFGTGWEHVGRDGEGRAYLLPTAERAYLISHLAKHFRFGGAGLRQMADLWLCRRAVPMPDDAELRDMLERLGLVRFAANIDQTLDAWFEDGAITPAVERITDFIFESGTFGTEQSNLQAFSVRRTGGEGVRSHSIISRLFPPRDDLRFQYPVLERAPALLRFVWIWRLGDMALFHRRRVRTGLRRIRLTRPEEVRQYAEMLESVGLDPQKRNGYTE